MIKRDMWIEYDQFSGWVCYSETDLHRPLKRTVHRLLADDRYSLIMRGVYQGDAVDYCPQQRQYFVDVKKLNGTINRIYLALMRNDKGPLPPTVWSNECPCPPVRNALDVKWRYGRWYKLHKKKGWVPIA